MKKQLLALVALLCTGKTFGAKYYFINEADMPVKVTLFGQAKPGPFPAVVIDPNAYAFIDAGFYCGDKVLIEDTRTMQEANNAAEAKPIDSLEYGISRWTACHQYQTIRIYSTQLPAVPVVGAIIGALTYKGRKPFEVNYTAKQLPKYSDAAISGRRKMN